jgi:LacI family transcriptional regulator
VRTTRPTMRDVAVRAGVSLKTVSRVINGEAGVAPTTATRVVAAIAELGFQRNDLARSLRQGRTSSTLGLVIEDVSNPFYSTIAQAVEAAAHEHGYMLITASCEEDPERERELVEALLRRRVDALLLVPASRDHAYLARDGTPVIFLDRPPVGVDADCVLLDNVGGARAATEHLLEHGHERIAFVADPDDLYTAAERLAGYREALEAEGLPVRDELVRLGVHDTARAEAVVRGLLALPEPPTAVFTANNRLTVGALKALHDEHVALVGFDDFELADLLGTTVVRHDSHRMGSHAAALAFDRLDGVARATRRVTLPTELVMRGSGEIPPP